MMIHFLGNGGFIGNGLPYNSFLIDGSFLIECPPDIMPSMRAQDISLSRIKRIFLSHFHGDHYFGMPFLTLNLFAFYPEQTDEIDRIDIIGPKGTRDHVIKLQQIAVSPDNPSVSRLDLAFNFVEINESSRLKINDKDVMIFHRMSHSKETYGFSIIRNNAYELTYLADTVWDESFLKIIAERPKYVVCDLNGDPADKAQAHMAEKDIVEKAIAVTGDSTIYVGTHLRDNRVATRKNIIYATVGTKIETAG